MSEAVSKNEKVHIGLGSNIGDRESYIRRALQAVDALAETRVVSVSSLYATEPRIVEDQPEFLNACATIETALSPRKLLDELLRIETNLDRVRTRSKGARTIDLDILLWEGRCVDASGLTLPHPGLSERAFVLIPLCEIAPDVCDPSSGCTVTELRERCPDTGGVDQVPESVPVL